MRRLAVATLLVLLTATGLPATAADPVDLGRPATAPHEEALQRAQHGEAEGGEEQDGK